MAGLLWIEVCLRGSVAAFSTRVGGLDLGPTSEKPNADVRKNRRRFAESLGLDPASVAIGRQVHGTRVLRWTETPEGATLEGSGDGLEAADGHVTTSAATPVAVVVADCLPVVLFAEGGVAVLHCGWRGIDGGIVPGGVAELSRATGGDPTSMSAAIGPGIGRCCFAVGDDVRARFTHRRRTDVVSAGGNVDLVAVVRHELEDAGVMSDQIASADLCTSCNADLFYSYRRDGAQTGRQGAVAWVGEARARNGADPRRYSLDR